MSFQGFLKQSTAVDVLLGPFLDEDDGKTAEAGLTISQADVKLSKNGQSLAQKNDANACAADGTDGYYNCPLNTTDTNTVGQLTVIVHESGALPVRLDYHVVEEAVYDAMYGGSAAGPLQPTTAGRKLDVSDTGEAGLDFDNIKDATGAHTLTNITIPTVTTLTDHTPQTGDSYDYLETNLGALGVNATEVGGDGDQFSAIPETDVNVTKWGGTAVASARPKVDVDTIKTQTITCSAGVEFGVYVGSTAAASTHDAAAVVTALGTGSTLTDCLTATSVTVSDKTDFKLASDGMDSVTLPANIITATSIDGDAITSDKIADDAIGDEHWNVTAASVNLVQINGTAIAGTGSQVAAAFEYFFDVVSPAKTINDCGVEGSGLSAEDVWTYATRVLTAGTNIDGSTFDALPDVTVASDGMDGVTLPADIITTESINTGAFTADAFAADALVAATFADNSLDGKGDWGTGGDATEANQTSILAALGTAAAKDGQAATIAGMVEATYDRVERNAGYDRLPIYGNAKLFDIDTDNGETVNGSASWPSVVYDSDYSRWTCFYTATVDTLVIRRRHSTDGKTSWSASSTALGVGTGGEWDERNVWAPVVWIEGSTWHMLYTGRDNTPTAISIGHATSDDGVTWERDPENPIITGDQAWQLQGSYYTAEVTGVIKVGSTYYVWFCSLVSPLKNRKIGVAYGDDLTDLTVQTAPVFGDPDGSTDVQRYSGYYAASPLYLSGTYYLVVSRYGAGGDTSIFELWESTDPLFPATTRERVKIVQTTAEDDNEPNKDIDIIGFATDDVTRTTFTQAGEFRMYFGGDYDGVWYTYLATADSTRVLTRYADDQEARILSVLPSSRWAYTQEDLASDTVTAIGDTYHADIYAIIDETNTKDEYTVVWFKNGVRITSGITNPTIRVVERSTGDDLIAAGTAMSEITGTQSFKYDEATNRLTAGEPAVAIVSATIDGSSREFARPVGRDSSA
jgi:hypothetical protein